MYLSFPVTNVQDEHQRDQRPTNTAAEKGSRGPGTRIAGQMRAFPDGHIASVQAWRVRLALVPGGALGTGKPGERSLFVLFMNDIEGDQLLRVRSHIAC